MIRLRHAGQKHLVLESQPRQRFVIREGDRGHGRRFGTDHHAAVGHGRKPMIAVADVELGPIEAHAEHRAGGHGAAVVGDYTGAGQEVIVRLDVALRRQLPGALQRQPVLVGHGAVGAVGDRARRAGVSDPVVVGVSLEVFLHLHAQSLVAQARLGQCELHEGHGEGTLEDGFIRQDQHTFDLALHLGLEVQRQIGADAIGVRALGQRSDQTSRRHSKFQCLDPRRHDSR